MVDSKQEKSNAALTSVIAAVCLTTFKIIVGISTGSMGIIAEAAHSGLDLLAALVTLIAVHFSSRPADNEHQYGHGKIENLSALFEALLLVATSVWIIYESTQRLIHHTTQVDVTIWAFIVMAVSILIDATRSRVLFNAAKKFNSQALEADALHFSTDILSSSVVILGLIGVTASEYIGGLGWMKQADAVAAIIVALIVLYVSYNLAKRTIDGLMDTAPKGMTDKIKRSVTTIPGVCDCQHIRVRNSGAETFIDACILVDPSLNLGTVHNLTDAVEAAIREIVPEADITVHPEPMQKDAKQSQMIGVG